MLPTPAKIDWSMSRAAVLLLERWSLTHARSRSDAGSSGSGPEVAPMAAASSSEISSQVCGPDRSCTPASGLPTRNRTCPGPPPREGPQLADQPEVDVDHLAVSY